MKPEVSKNIFGEGLPVLTPNPVTKQIVDGSLAHQESSPLGAGVYRLAVMTSTDNAGLMIKISLDGSSATAVADIFMPHNMVETFSFEEGTIISVINGKLNIIQLY